jgi:hypothetical protein
MPKIDLESIQDIVRAADPEGLLAAGAPQDEYEPEEDELYAELEHLPASEITEELVHQFVADIWESAFDSESTPEREAGLNTIVERIVHFFGLDSIY